jgi:hypothetical protein
MIGYDIGYDSVSRSWYYCRGEGRPIITGFATRYDAERYAEKCSDERRKIDARCPTKLEAFIADHG